MMRGNPIWLRLGGDEMSISQCLITERNNMYSTKKVAIIVTMAVLCVTWQRYEWIKMEKKMIR